MLFLWITLSTLLFLALFSLLISFICFLRIFYSPKRKQTEEYPTPVGEIYDPFREDMIKWMKFTRTLPHEDIAIKSFDGLTLRGKYFEYKKGAPIEILMHGYRGCAERDMSGGVNRCHALERSALIVDHRASGESEGNVITFGINESRDCLSWVNYITEHIDKDAKIILTGISMGAATVMIASAKEELPKNVVGVLADCGYTSAKQIIKKVMREMRLPPDLLYPFVRLGGRLFGRFDIDETSPVESMKRARVPVIFFHGDTDAFVPIEMSVQNYEACVTKKRLVTINGAGHGLCFPMNKETYFEELKLFFDPLLEEK